MGVDTYKAVGGKMLQDLIQGDESGWIEVALDLRYGYSHRLRSLSRDPASMTDDEGAAQAKLLA